MPRRRFGLARQPYEVDVATRTAQLAALAGGDAAEPGARRQNGVVTPYPVFAVTYVFVWTMWTRRIRRGALGSLVHTVHTISQVTINLVRPSDTDVFAGPFGLFIVF